MTKARKRPARRRAPKLAPFSPADVVGTTFHAFKGRVPEIKPGAIVILRAEPTNLYDPFAVVVLLGAEKLGYLERDKDLSTDPFPNPQIFVARLLAAGVPVHAVVERTHLAAGGNVRVRLNLFVERA